MCELARSLAAEQPNRLGILSSAEHLDGCTCMLYLNGDHKKPLFMSELKGQPAWVNVDGRDVELSLQTTTEKNMWTLGARFSRTYAAGDGLRVLVQYRVVSVCKPNTECDGSRVSGSLTLNPAEARSSLPARGFCGC